MDLILHHSQEMCSLITAAAKKGATRVLRCLIEERGAGPNQRGAAHTEVEGLRAHVAALEARLQALEARLGQQEGGGL